ncbi:MAG: Uma2 family endonuclease [Phototrophicaceae bacterium]
MALSRLEPIYGRMTVEEYLAFERASDEKHEYIDGKIYAMAGAKPHHVLIATNIARSLGNQLEEGPCTVYQSDLKVNVKTKSGFVYPDIVVVCGDLEYYDDSQDIITNPILIVEVLSPSTEKRDRTTKFRLYEALPSLQAYVLVSQDEVNIEQYWRNGETWGYEAATSLDRVLTLPSIDCTLALSQVYRKVTFDDPTAPDTSSGGYISPQPPR